MTTGLTETEAKSAFNQNMMSTGLLDEGPARFGNAHGRRWLVSEYEAGDVVLHNSYMVRLNLLVKLLVKADRWVDSCFDN